MISGVKIAPSLSLDLLVAGTYRLSYYGDAKPLVGSIATFVGRSSNFTVA